MKKHLKKLNHRRRLLILLAICVTGLASWLIFNYQIKERTVLLPVQDSYHMSATHTWQFKYSPRKWYSAKFPGQDPTVSNGCVARLRLRNSDMSIGMGSCHNFAYNVNCYTQTEAHCHHEEKKIAAINLDPAHKFTFNIYGGATGQEMLLAYRDTVDDGQHWRYWVDLSDSFASFKDASPKGANNLDEFVKLPEVQEAISVLRTAHIVQQSKY